MQHPFGIYIRLVRKLRGGETTKMNKLTTQDDLREPFIASGLVVSAKTIAFCSSLRNQLVLHIYRMCHISKIRESIVSFFAVYVVYFSNRPVSIGIEKCKSVCKIPASVNANLKVPAGVQYSDNITYKPPTANSLQSGKFARLTVIGIKLFEAILREFRIVISHNVSPVKKLIGQRPGRVISTSRLRYFTVRLNSSQHGLLATLQAVWPKRALQRLQLSHI